MLILALLAVTPAFARTWTDLQGRTLEADLVKTTATTVTLRREDGRMFDLALAQLSAADRAFATGPSTGASAATVPFADLNAMLGLDLLADDNLWDDEPAAAARRLHLPLEGKNLHFESYRAYPKKPISVLGAPAYMLSLQSSEGHITAVTLMFANRGDYPPFLGRDSHSFLSKAELKEFDQALKTDFDSLTVALTAKLGAPKRETVVGGLEPNRHVLRWEADGHAFLVSHDAEQMVSLKIVPADRNGTSHLSDEQVRRMLKERLTKRPGGDVIIDQVPMVSQGPKGYCVPATFERYLRYVGIPADMYELAEGGGTGFGGTSFEAMAAGLDRYVRRQGRHLDKATFKFNINSIARYLDEGRPIIWGLYSTKAFNELSSALTEARGQVADWPKWKKTVAASDTSQLGPDRESAHACLIIGYNRATNEIAFTDSWGPAFAERWVGIDAAQKVSQDQFWVISW
ncbi:MAG: C39 family peptidase [Verrucomicrobia bacterium]|nr:C39 family peptidase [Verrucomicrobiota bacterium]